MRTSNTNQGERGRAAEDGAWTRREFVQSTGAAVAVGALGALVPWRPVQAMPSGSAVKVVPLSNDIQHDYVRKLIEGQHLFFDSKVRFQFKDAHFNGYLLQHIDRNLKLSGIMGRKVHDEYWEMWQVVDGAAYPFGTQKKGDNFPTYKTPQGSLKVSEDYSFSGKTPTLTLTKQGAAKEFAEAQYLARKARPDAWKADKKALGKADIVGTNDWHDVFSVKDSFPRKKKGETVKGTWEIKAQLWVLKSDDSWLDGFFKAGARRCNVAGAGCLISLPVKSYPKPPKAKPDLKRHHAGKFSVKKGSEPDSSERTK